MSLCSAVAFLAGAAAQEQPAAEALPGQPAKQPVLRTLGEQTWHFTDIQATYEPRKGSVEPRGGQAGNQAVWTLRLVKDMDPGAARLQEEMRGSPFRIVLLDAERTVINQDIVPQITPISGKAEDTIQLYVPLPDAPLLREVKYIRVERRTNVGF
jgi:hypothetical protein